MSSHTIKLIFAISIFFIIVNCKVKQKIDLQRNVIFSYLLNESAKSVYPKFGEIYQDNNNISIRTKNEMDKGSINLQIIKIEDIFLITGGYNPYYNGQLKDAYIFSSSCLCFKQTADMNMPRVAHSTIKISNIEALILGGFTTDSIRRPTNTIERFNLNTMSFSNYGKMLTERADHKSELLNDDSILIVGGLTFPNYVTEIERYYFNSNTSVITDVLNKPRINFTLHKVYDGRIFIIGGYFNDGLHFEEHISLVEVIDQNGVVVSTFPLNVKRSRHSSVLTNDNKILIFGGENEEGFVDTVEEINVLNNSIVSYKLPSGNLRSFDQSLILNNSIFSFGGNIKGGVSNNINNSSVNDPGSIQIKTMLSPRSLHKSINLNSNEILTVGGASVKIIN